MSSIGLNIKRKRKITKVSEMAKFPEKIHSYDEEGNERVGIEEETHITRNKAGEVIKVFGKIKWKDTGNKRIITENDDAFIIKFYNKKGNLIKVIETKKEKEADKEQLEFSHIEHESSDGFLKTIMIILVACAILYYFLVTKIP